MRKFNTENNIYIFVIYTYNEIVTSSNLNLKMINAFVYNISKEFFY